MGFVERWRRFVGADQERSLEWPWPYTFSMAGGPGGSMFGYGLQTTMTGQKEVPASGFEGLVDYALRSNGVVAACVAVRLRVFTEARFAFQRLRAGRPAGLWTDPGLLSILEHPWTGGTTGDLLGRSLLSFDVGGNAFIAKLDGRLQVLRPDWTVIISGLPNDDESNGWDLGAEVLGYGYTPGGPRSGRDPIPLFPDQVAHFAPMPDPLAPWRGMSWLSPVLREIRGDSAATSHKLAFFENAATPNLKVKADPTLNPDNFKKWVDIFKQGHEGLTNAYKTIYLGGGADAEVIGANLRQMDFKLTQGAGETRIAAAAGVPPVLVGLSEGLQAATYSNYGQARRAFGDQWARPMWRNFAGSLEAIIETPSDSRLWYDDRDVPFLREDSKDAAEIQGALVTQITALVKEGFPADDAVAAVMAEDLSLLKGKHTGLVSVQLQEPGTEFPTNGKAPPNGKAPAEAVTP